ncbi:MULTISPECIES: hypothetical protein [unclassified Acidovorax]|uniref:hypothetical protein n=1 Tax=unclassified Acidovorax TaxID=2684926 RepID=UPI001C45D3BD|nr:MULTISPECIES: hypothetical protein [unclassified Acidovorax]MBV7428071.1 hypothetical protein [Acidovorax sp. sif0732]MBV7449328.1 hypothetical protein [Acidovorax sp. sif0715]
MLNEIRMAVASLAGAKTVAEGLVAERDARKIAEAVDSLLEKIAGARMTVLSLQDSLEAKNNALAALQEEKRHLELELRRALQNADQFEGYELADIARGTMVYAPKPGADGIRRPPYLCPTCKGNGKNSILSFQDATVKTPGRKLVCPEVAGHTLTLPRGSWTPENLGRTGQRMAP